MLKKYFSISGALIIYFLEGIAALRHLYLNPNQKSRIQIFSSE